MNFNFRKILIIGIIILGILILVLGSFALFRSPKNSISLEENEVLNNNQINGQELSTTTQENDLNQSIEQNIQEIQRGSRVNQLSERAVMGICLNKPSDRIVYYDKETGQVFRTDFSGKIWERISDAETREISKITWSLSRDKVIIEQGSKKYVYDYESNEKHELDSHIKNIVFSPSGDHILYHYWDLSTESNIAVANYDGSNWKSIIPSEMTGLEIAWPRQDTVSFLTPEGSFYGNTLYFTKLQPPYDLEEIMDDKFGLKVNWSPSGNKLLYSYRYEKDDKDSELYLRDFENETEINLGLNTLPENCMWLKNEKALYCAEKANNFLNIIPEDYQKKLNLTGDSFWKIDLETKEFKEIYIPEASEQVYDAGELIVSDREDFLFFVNNLDGKLYSLSL